MATVALKAVSTALLTPFLGPFAPQVGAAAGAYIDAAIIGPAISGANKDRHITGPRVSEFDAALAQEGAAIPSYYGPETAGPCLLIYASKFREEPVTTSSRGGKGGGSSASTTNFTYFVDLLLMVGDGEINDVTKLFGDGKKILEKRKKFQRFSTNFTVTARNGWMLIDTQGQSLRQLVVGRNVQLANFSNGGNNLTTKVRGVKRIDAANNNWRLRVWNPSAVNEAPNGVGKWIVQTGAAGGAGRADDIEVFTGSSAQAKWSTLESDKTTALTPNFRDTSLIGVTNLALDDFAEHIPNMTCWVKEANVVTLQDTLTRIMTEGGMDASDFDVTRCRGRIIGMRADGLTNGLARIAPLMNAYQLRARESSGKTVLFEKGNEDTITVDAGDIVVRETRFEVTNLDKGELPSAIALKYTDYNNKHEPGLVTETHPLADFENTIDVDVPVVLTAGEARKIARDLLYEKWATNKAVTFALGPKYLDIEETDKLTIPYNNETWVVRVTELTRGANGEIEIQGVVDDASIVDRDNCADGVDPDLTVDDDPPIPTPSEVALHILDIPAIEVDRASTPGYYIAVSPYDDLVQWDGATVYQSDRVVWPDPDAVGVNWNVRAGSVPSYTIMGEAATKLGSSKDILPTSDPDYTGDDLATVPGAWDESTKYNSKPIVEIFRGTLSDADSDDDVLAGQNNFLIGNEIVGARYCTELSPGRYQLSRLLRGLRDTRWAMTEHEVGERVVLLDTQGLYWVKKFTGAIGQLKWFRAVPPGGVVSDFEEETDYETANGGRFEANTLRPFAPTNLVLTSGSDIAITWEFVTRQFTSPLAEGQPPLDEEETYEVDVYENADRNTVVRTFTATGSYTPGNAETADSSITVNGDGTSSLHYDSIDIATDGLSTPYFRVYQVHRNFGRGNYNEIY